MTESRCKLALEPAQVETCGVNELIQKKAAEQTPLLAWGDPDPQGVNLVNASGRREDFQPLVLGAPSWPNDLRLVEARLFWPTAALHVVASEGGGCRWTTFEESGSDAGLEVAWRKITVFTLRDLARFGLQAGQAIDNLAAIEYRQQGRLIGWRLTIKVQERSHADRNY